MHLGNEDIETILLGAPPAALKHLLDCARCRGRLREIVDEEAVGILGRPTEPSRLAEALLSRAVPILAEKDETAYQRAVKGAYQATVQASALFEQLLELPPKQRFEALEQDPGFRSQHLVHLLLGAGEQAADPNLAHHFGLLAVTVLDRLDLPTLKVLAFCLIAEAQRRRGEVEVAEDIAKSAALEIESELLTTPVRARFCRTLAGIRADQSRVDEALALLERACALSEENADFDELAKSRLEQGLLLLEEYDHEGALRALQEALPLIDSTLQPRLALAALHALALTCADLGRSVQLEEVLDALDALRPLLPERMDGLRLRWIRAQVHWRLGQAKAATERLQRVFSALIEDRASGVETATAALELARMYLERQPPAKPTVFQDLLLAVRSLALEGRLSQPLWAVTSFALTLAQGERGFKAEVLDSAIRYLHLAQYNPKLPFQPLRDPDEIVNWRELDAVQRRATARAAGIELPGETLNPRQMHLLAWTHEAFHGIRIQFPDHGAVFIEDTPAGRESS